MMRMKAKVPTPGHHLLPRPASAQRKSCRRCLHAWTACHVVAHLLASSCHDATATAFTDNTTACQTSASPQHSNLYECRCINHSLAAFKSLLLQAGSLQMRPRHLKARPQRRQPPSRAAWGSPRRCRWACRERRRSCRSPLRRARRTCRRRRGRRAPSRSWKRSKRSSPPKAWSSRLRYMCRSEETKRCYIMQDPHLTL